MCDYSLYLLVPLISRLASRKWYVKLVSLSKGSFVDLSVVEFVSGRVVLTVLQYTRATAILLMTVRNNDGGLIFSYKAEG